VGRGKKFGWDGDKQVLQKQKVVGKKKSQNQQNHQQGRSRYECSKKKLGKAKTNVRSPASEMSILRKKTNLCLEGGRKRLDKQRGECRNPEVGGWEGVESREKHKHEVLTQ